MHCLSGRLRCWRAHSRRSEPVLTPDGFKQFRTGRQIVHDEIGGATSTRLRVRSEWEHPIDLSMDGGRFFHTEWPLSRSRLNSSHEKAQDMTFFLETRRVDLDMGF